MNKIHKKKEEAHEKGLAESRSKTGIAGVKPRLSG
jgi:hypothetical protein